MLSVRIPHYVVLIICVLVMLVRSRSSGADQPPPPVPSIRFLPGPVPTPPPQPAPDPTAIPVLAGETIDVIDSDVDVQVDAFPAGLVTITTEPGPLKVRGHFLDSPKTLQTRLFKGKQVITVEAVAGASGQVTVVVIPPGANTPSDWKRKRIDVGGPRPPPGPAPTPAPPAPAPGAKLFGVVVADRLNLDPAQAAAIDSPAFRAYLTAAGHELDQLDTRTSSDTEKAKLAQYQPFVTQAKVPAGTAALVLVDAGGPTKGLVRSVVAVPTSDTALIAAFKTVVGP